MFLVRISERPGKVFDVALRYGAVVILGIIVLVLSFTTRKFLTVLNLLNLSRQISILAIIAIGTTFVLISGGIDLSIGSVVGLSGLISVVVLLNTGSIMLALVSALATGALVGSANGVLIARGKLSPFIVTLAMMLVARGIVMLYTRGYAITIKNLSYVFLGYGSIGFIPVSITLLLPLYLLAYFILSWTKLGRYTYSMGSNEEAAVRTGINVANYKTWIYTLGGITAAIGGIISVARAASAQPLSGQGLEFDAIAATVIGGTSLKGGRGNLLRTFVGVIIIGVIFNGIALLGISAVFYYVAKGVVLLSAVSLDRWTREEAS